MGFLGADWCLQSDVVPGSTSEGPDLFQVYHEGFQSQVDKWPVRQLRHRFGTVSDASQLIHRTRRAICSTKCLCLSGADLVLALRLWRHARFTSLQANPVNKAIDWLKARPKSLVVADFVRLIRHLGCFFGTISRGFLRPKQKHPRTRRVACSTS